MDEQSDVVIPQDKVMSVEEASEHVRRVAAAAGDKQWRWWGNFGDPHDAATAANNAGRGPGELITMVAPNGLVPTWLYV